MKNGELKLILNLHHLSVLTTYRFKGSLKRSATVYAAAILLPLKRNTDEIIICRLILNTPITLIIRTCTVALSAQVSARGDVGRGSLRASRDWSHLMRRELFVHTSIIYIFRLFVLFLPIFVVKFTVAT